MAMVISFTTSGIMDIYTLLTVLMLVAAGARRPSINPQRKLYFQMLGLLIIVLELFSALAAIEGTPGNWTMRVGSFFLFFLDSLTEFIWIRYVASWVRLDKRERRRWFAPVDIVTFANFAATVANLWTGWLYTAEADGTYFRGPYFMLRAVILVLTMFYCEYFILRMRQYVSKDTLRSLLLFPVAPFIGGGLQAFIPNAPNLEHASAGFVYLFIFLFVQNRDMNTDHLTGVGNRRLLDIVLENHLNDIAHDESVPAFSCVMMDLDHFKCINDTYGHTEGDHALISTAEILAEVFGPYGTVARYGGDEFVCLLDIDNRHDLDRLVADFRGALKAYNGQRRLDFPIEVSIGSTVYDRALHPDAQEFLHSADDLMYEEKRAKGNDR